MQEKQTKALKSPQIPSTPKSLIYLERLQKKMHLFKKGHNIWRTKQSSRKIKCMSRNESQQKSLELKPRKFSESRTKKQREKCPLIRKLEDWTRTSNICLKGVSERETDKTEGCKIFQYSHKMFQNGRMKVPHQKRPMSSQSRG